MTCSSKPEVSVERDRQAGDLGRITVGLDVGIAYRRGDLRFVEAVGPVESEQILLVSVEEFLTVASAAGVGVGFLHLQIFAQQVAGEVLVALDVDRHNLVRLPLIHGVKDDLLIGSRLLLRDLHNGIEISLLLQVILHVVGALIQQVVIDSSLFVDGEEQVQTTLGELRPGDLNPDNRPLFYVEIVVQSLGNGIVGGLAQSDSSFEAIFLLEIIPEIFEG